MNIKEEIGRRILEERKAKGLTRKALAELTDDLKQSRINNWERGIRTPGPGEIKQLASALDVSPAFLMCLTSEKQPRKTPRHGALLPLLTHEQACDPKAQVQAIKSAPNTDSFTFIPVGTEIGLHLGEHAFALKMNDDSMDPELRRNDILIIDPDGATTPGCFVVANLEDNFEIVVRRYKQLSASRNNNDYELLALNAVWANIRVDKTNKSKMIGTVIAFFRHLEPQ